MSDDKKAAKKAAGKTGWKAAENMPEELHRPLSGLLLSLADNKRLLGMRYSEWILGAPTLEAGIACSAMAQDEWGHGRILYAMLKDFGHESGSLEHEREADAYVSSELLDEAPDGWPGLLALNALLDQALSVQCDALAESRYSPLHYKMGKLADEERFHAEHARGWTQRLAGADAGRVALAAAYSAALEPCLRWFGRDGADMWKALTEQRVVDGGPDTLRARWLERVGPLLEDVGLDVPPPAGDALDWADWDDERRRTGPGGPDADTLARVRGDKNRAMLMD
ncbi:MAG: Phenylacetic acid catabolic protein [Gemmatimonadota bacterium]